MMERALFKFDFSGMMADCIGPDGISEEEIEEIAPAAREGAERLIEGRRMGVLKYLDLPYQREEIEGIIARAKWVREGFEDFVLLGIGGSALGARAIFQALCHPFHNLLPRAIRGGPRVFILDNADPDSISSLMEIISPEGAFFNVVSKSGATVETAAQYLLFRRWLEDRLGLERAKGHLAITTDPQGGDLRRVAERDGIASFSVPPGVEGRYSVLSPVGLFPAAVMGVNPEELLDGAARMDGALKELDPFGNMALMWASLFYLADRKKGKNIIVMMPYSDRLVPLGLWFRQLWAESLGKGLTTDGRAEPTGTTPEVAVGSTDQHSQLQLYKEGPRDKVVAFIRVEEFERGLEIPAGGERLEAFSYLGGHTFNELMACQAEATARTLTRGERPNCSLLLPRVTPQVLGQLFYFFEVATAAAGWLYRVNPYDQPGVEEGKQILYAMMGRKGYEDKRETPGEVRRSPRGRDYVL